MHRKRILLEIKARNSGAHYYTNCTLWELLLRFGFRKVYQAYRFRKAIRL